VKEGQRKSYFVYIVRESRRRFLETTELFANFFLISSPDVSFFFFPLNLSDLIVWESDNQQISEDKNN